MGNPTKNGRDQAKCPSYRVVRLMEVSVKRELTVLDSSKLQCISCELHQCLSNSINVFLFISRVKHGKNVFNFFLSAKSVGDYIEFLSQIFDNSKSMQF